MARVKPVHIRLYVEAPLAAGAPCALSAAQAHRARHVMRLKTGDALSLFNAAHGEWDAVLDDTGARIERQLRPPADEPGPELVFAPVKQPRAEFLVEKLTELGVGALRPVITERTVVRGFNAGRALAHAIAAAEQCGRLSIPAIHEPVSLDAWTDRAAVVFWADPLADIDVAEAFRASPAGEPPALVVGPEGGFSGREREWLATFATAVRLGPATLRAETAALALVATWQALAGAWHGGRQTQG